MDKTIQDTSPKAHKNIRGREYYAQAAEEAKARLEAEYKNDPDHMGAEGAEDRKEDEANP